MRIWVGKEQEGMDFGIETLFVESRTITPDLFPIIFNALSEYDIGRIYLGAGRIDCVRIDDAAHFIYLCAVKHIQVVQETSVECLKYVSSAVMNYGEIIITVRDKKVDIPLNASFKIDNYKEAGVYQGAKVIITEISDVKDNMYSCDKIIFETNKEEKWAEE